MILTWLPIDAISSTLFTAGLSQPFPALRLQVTVNTVPVHISTTHLYAWDATVRAAQLAVLQTWLSAQGARRVVTGDFNAFPLETTMWNGNWTLEYVDAWQTATSWIQPTDDGGFTFDRRTATQNPERIDYHWTTGMTVSEMFVVKTRRSDHHALVVDYKVP
jgi:endonuclease/exonuclease/phosphatase family metal-dependent hydrolase